MKANNKIAQGDPGRRQFLQQTGILLAGVLTSPAIHAESFHERYRVIKIGVIGCGSRGVGLISILKEVKGTRITACCDLIPRHLSNGLVMTGGGAKSYTDYRQLLDDKNVDAVIIATPLFLHFPMAVDALAAGKHVYLEKSLAYDIPQSLELVKKVRDSKLVFQVGYQYRYYGLYHKVKQVIADRWLGKITHFEAQYHRNSDWRVPVDDPKMERILNWRMYREYCGGPLSELCAHQIDAVNFLLDSHPLKVTAIGGINYWKDGRETYDHIRAVYEYPDGIKASFSSVLSNAFEGYFIRILGDKGTVEIERDKAFIYAELESKATGIVDGVTGATITNATQGKQRELQFRKSVLDDLEPTVLSLRDFILCINEKRTPASNVETASNSSVAVHMGNISAETETYQAWKPEYSV